jgi:hypothetical protein
MDNQTNPVEEITLQTADGRTVYWPPGNMGRLAPAAVCAVASRIQRLRKEIESFPPEIRAKLAPFVAPLPFEQELLSGKIEQVHGAIRQLGSPKIAIRVAGGAVQAIYSDHPELEVTLWDVDRLIDEGVQWEALDAAFDKAVEGMSYQPKKAPII